MDLSMISKALLLTAVVFNSQTIVSETLYDNITLCESAIEILNFEYIRTGRTEEIYCTCVNVEETGEEI